MTGLADIRKNWKEYRTRKPWSEGKPRKVQERPRRPYCFVTVSLQLPCHLCIIYFVSHEVSVKNISLLWCQNLWKPNTIRWLPPDVAKHVYNWRGSHHELHKEHMVHVINMGCNPSKLVTMEVTCSPYYIHVPFCKTGTLTLNSETLHWWTARGHCLYLAG